MTKASGPAKSASAPVRGETNPILMVPDFVAAWAAETSPNVVRAPVAAMAASALHALSSAELECAPTRKGARRAELFVLTHLLPPSIVFG